MRELWSKKQEEEFFKRTLQIAAPEQLFYLIEHGRYVAYWPKKYEGKKATLQSRNSFIGSYTEKWVKNLLEPIADKFNLYTVNHVKCNEIGLDENSPMDVAITKTPEMYQKPENIVILVEVKMSIVWNWEYNPNTGKLICIGDFTTHQGNPGLLRSDTMLKAIGKSINIRISSYSASRIPIIVIGNTPITQAYYSKVDQLKKTGIIQGFYSVNPKPLDKDSPINIKSTSGRGFVRIDNYGELEGIIKNLITENRDFFSAMITRSKLGEIIEIAGREPTYEGKAEKFLEMIRESHHGD